MDERVQEAVDALFLRARAEWEAIKGDSEFGPIPRMRLAHIFKHFPVRSEIPSPQVVRDYIEFVDSSKAIRKVEELLDNCEERLQLDELAKNRSKEKDQVWFAVLNLTRYAAMAAVGVNFDLEDVLRRFNLAIESSPYVRHRLLTLYGVTVKEGPIRVEKGEASLIFREPTDDEIQASIDHLFNAPEIIGTDVPTIAIWVTSAYKEDRGGYNQMLGEAARRMLALFNVGTVAQCSSIEYPEPLIEMGARSGSKIPWMRETFSFEISSEESADLQSHCIALWEVLRKTTLTPGNLSYLSRSLDYYLESLDETNYHPRQISAAIRALESLLLRDDKEGIAHLLSSRVALICDLCNIDVQPVLAAIKQAYEIRSKHVHGEEFSDKNDKKLRSKFEPIGGLIGFMDIVRRCVLLAHLMETEKEEWLSLLRDGMISRRGRKILDERFSVKAGHLASMTRLHTASMPVC